MIVTPSAPRPDRARPAMSRETSAQCPRSSSEMSRMSRAWARGITSAWPRVAGLMSIITIARWSSWMRIEGSSPATIRQKMQSSMRRMLSPAPRYDRAMETDPRPPLVPDGFVPPAGLAAASFLLEPLGPQHNESDYDAWTSSMEHITATPGYPDGNWPP